MKKIISKIPYQIIIILSFIATTFVFGITVGGERAFVIYLIFEFLIGCLICWLLKTKIKAERRTGKIFDYIGILLFSFFIVSLSTLFYHTANRAKSEFVREYDTVITEVSYGRWGNTAWFTDPDSEEQAIDFIDWKIIYNDNQDEVDAGDEIHIIEQNGLFNVTYYVIGEE